MPARSLDPLAPATPGRRRVLLCPIGSSGDVHPFLWIGRLLRARGHAVSVLANPVFAPPIAALGLRPVPFGDEAEYRAMLDHPEVWHPTRGTPLVLRFAGEVTARHFAAIAAIAEETPDAPPLVLAPATAFGARLARERLGLPLVTVHLQPSVFLSVGDPPRLARGLGWIGRLPPAVQRGLFALIRARIGLEVNPGVRRACRAVGVAPPRNAFRDWWQSPDGGLALWPEWFAAPQPDWPAGVACVGFPLYDLSDLADHFALPPALAAFLAAGEPPVLFTAGTAMAQGAPFFAAALAAIRATGGRAIFATKFPTQLPPGLPPEVFAVAYTPFSQLLPRCAAIVHHGGIGTTAQALAAGRPQLIMPLAHDQPDNAARVARRGLGATLWPRDFTAENLTRALRALLADAPRRQRCAEVAARVRADDPAPRLLAALAPHLSTAAR